MTHEAIIIGGGIGGLAVVVVPLEAWWSGRVVLLGDAALATTPNLGQGACQALESAVVLADCLAGHENDPAAGSAVLERAAAYRVPGGES